jgi:ABC-2 type transport system permease protein
MFKITSLIFIYMKQDLRSISSLLLRLFFYSLVVYLFTMIFKATSADSHFLNYIFVTQAIVSSFYPSNFEIYQELQSDSFALNHLKPIHYLFEKFTACLSIFYTRLIPLIMLGYGYFYLAGLPTNLNLWKFIICSLLSCIIYGQITNMIGFLSFWLKDPKILFYLNLTCSFALGGLIIPLHDYPTLIYKIAQFTPYPYLISYPVDIFVFQRTSLFNILLMQIFWLFITSCFTQICYHKIRSQKFNQ